VPASPDLLTFITDQFASGADVQTVRTRLLSAGWLLADIDDGLQQVGHAKLAKPALPVPDADGRIVTLDSVADASSPTSAWQAARTQFSVVAVILVVAIGVISLVAIRGGKRNAAPQVTAKDVNDLSDDTSPSPTATATPTPASSPETN
jgi:hypothetical protein